MRSLSRSAFWLITLIVSAVSLLMGATITGTVKGPDGKPFEGAFVEAMNTATNISTDVLSQEDGHYTVPNLPSGDYRLTIRAVGYKAAAQNKTLQTADQHAEANFALEKGTVSWSDLSVWQGAVLLPSGKGKEFLFGSGPISDSGFGRGGTCFACHNFQSRMASRRLNFQGWLGMVNFMRDDAVPYFIPRSRFTDQMSDQVASYLTQVFGLDSTLPASPADLPGYQATVRKFSNRAMNIVYVVYPITDTTWLPFQMYPPTSANGLPSDGSIWVGDYGNANRVERINPKTGQDTTYMVPTNIPNSTFPCIAEGIHAIEVGPHGDAWFAEQGCNRVGRVDGRTGKVTQYQDVAGRKGGKHDSHPMLVDGKLYVFSSGSATRLDPETGKFTYIPGIPGAYDVYEDPVNGNVWFTEPFGRGGGRPLYEVDPKTLKIVTSFSPSDDPKTFESHRIAFSSTGTAWVTCRGNRVCSFDPKTKAFKQYKPLGPDQSDYAIAVDQAGYVWYSMSDLDTIQRLDPKTGQIVEYPFPYPEITMRKFWLDSQGRIWTTTPANGVVVYWYLAGGKMRAVK